MNGGISGCKIRSAADSERTTTTMAEHCDNIKVPLHWNIHWAYCSFACMVDLHCRVMYAQFDTRRLLKGEMFTSAVKTWTFKQDFGLQDLEANCGPISNWELRIFDEDIKLFCGKTTSDTNYYSKYFCMSQNITCLEGIFNNLVTSSSVMFMLCKTESSPRRR